jgi:hypothetical protein
MVVISIRSGLQYQVVVAVLVIQEQQGPRVGLVEQEQLV